METHRPASSGHQPTPVEVTARHMYARVLSQWAMDLLQLRAQGLDVPGHRDGDGLLALPWNGAFRGHGERMRWIAGDARSALTWQPLRRAA